MITKYPYFTGYERGFAQSRHAVHGMDRDHPVRSRGSVRIVATGAGAGPVKMFWSRPATYCRD